MDPVELREGDQVLLPWQAEDADALFRACQDPLIQRWATGGSHRIEWRAHVGNGASRATAAGAGFRMEATHRDALSHRGTYEDVWLGVRLATDEATHEE